MCEEPPLRSCRAVRHEMGVSSKREAGIVALLTRTKTADEILEHATPHKRKELHSRDTRVV